MNRRGFTLIEVVIVVMIGLMLTSMVSGGFSAAQSRFAARGARDSFLSLHALARAKAIESGKTVRLRWDANGDSLWIEQDGVTTDVVNLQEDYHVDLVGSGSGSNPWTLCITARGYADTDCNSFSSLPKLSFRRGEDWREVTVLPLGQLSY